jgi:hypothetical protein
MITFRIVVLLNKCWIKKFFFFKMLVDGVAKGVNPVKQMQLGGDLENP